LKTATELLNPSFEGGEAPASAASLDGGSLFARLRLSASELRRARRRLHQKTLMTAVLGLSSYGALVLAPSPLYLQVLAAVVLVHALLATATGIMHDANHHAFSSRRWVNQLVAYSGDFLGASSMLWRLQHNTLHHRHTNVEGVDGDIDQMPFARLSPSQPLEPRHRFQHVYLWFLYGFLHIRWVLVGDYVGLVSYMKNPETRRGVSASGVAKMFLGKAVHLSWAVVVPCLFHPWWCVLGVYLGVSYAVGFMLAVTFQVAHCVQEADMVAFDPGTLKGDAMVIHQLNTTVDVEPSSLFSRLWVSYACGGLHMQVEHHIAPRIPHTAYPLLQKRVRELCREINVTHRTHQSVWRAVSAHGRHLRVMGRPQAV
jgi:linoleoyl-CoA desaturase